MDSIEEMVMGHWEDKGCAFCRRLWETGIQPSRLGISLTRNTYLHRCNVCRTYWEQYERYADVISNEDARNFYPEFVEGEIP